jgi:hypothetical protein
LAKPYLIITPCIRLNQLFFIVRQIELTWGLIAERDQEALTSVGCVC